jgi:hypothetical protein
VILLELLKRYCGIIITIITLMKKNGNGIEICCKIV